MLFFLSSSGICRMHLFFVLMLTFFAVFVCFFAFSSNQHCFSSRCCCSSTGFPVQTGRVSLKKHVQWAETACEVVKFPPFSFYPDKELHVQITTNHWNISEKNFIHDATVSWVETVNFENFEVNILKEVFNSSITSSSNQ